MDIGIDMMQRIMFLTPKHLAPSEQIECTSHEPVEPFAFGVATVCTVMRDIETRQRKTLCQCKYLQYCTNKRRREKDQEQVRNHQPGENHSRFHKHAPVTSFSQFAVRKILVHTPLDNLMKTSPSG